MSRSETLFIGCARSVEEASASIAAALRMDIHVSGNGRAVLSRILSSGAGTIKGIVKRNDLAEQEPEGGEVAAYDFGYEILLDIWAADRSAQGAEAMQIFSELVEAFPYMPILLAPNDAQELMFSYLPGRGVYKFPESTTPYSTDSELWMSWVACG